MAVIKTFNAPGRFRQLQNALQLVQSLAAGRLFVGLLLQLPVQHNFRIMPHQLQQALFLTNFRSQQIHSAAPLLVQPVVHRLHILQRLA